MKYIPRSAEKTLLEAIVAGKVVMILGARQVGKTTLVTQTLAKEKVAILNFDIELDRQRFLSASRLDPADALTRFGSPDILVIDEAQRIPETGRIIKGWYDRKLSCVFVLLGSSSLSLLDQSAEPLTGRNIKIPLPPLTFTEILAAESWYSPKMEPAALQADFAAQIDALLLERVVFGGYPEVVRSPKKEQLLLSLAGDYLLKDILHFGLVKTPEVLRKLLALLAHQCGALVSVHELSTTLGIARQTVERYLALLEDTYIIFRLPAFSMNPRKEITKSHKIFFWDTGIRNAILSDFSLSPTRSDIGMLWENWIIAEFAKRNLLSGSLSQLHFWRTRNGSEVDLVVRTNRAFAAYEIKWSAKKRATTAFTEEYKVPVTRISRTELDALLES
ncbi:MAG TPA: ATP-binding protein [bacterium]|nr:ATP-binding protein [bacterium]